MGASSGSGTTTAQPQSGGTAPGTGSFSPFGASVMSNFLGGSPSTPQAPPPRMPSSTVYPTFSSSDVATGSPEDVGRVDAAIRQNVQGMMGDYRGMVDLANQTNVSQADIARAGGVPMGGVYTYMNRPGYQTYGPNGQFNQPIYQTSYDRYAQPSSFYRPAYNPFAYGGGMGGMGGMGPQSSEMPNRAAMANLPMYAMYAEGGDIQEDQGIAALGNK